jgi:hypothetical protein
MSAASRSQTLSAATRLDGASLASRAVVAALAIAGLAAAACGSSSSAKPADGGTGAGGAATGAAGSGAVGTGGKGAGGGSVASTGGQTASSADAGTGTGTDAAMTTADYLGLPCNSDRDCGTILNCMKATGNDIVSQGGPAGGYCSFKCSDMADAKCTTLGGSCNDLGTMAVPALYCLQSCTLGGDATTKCHARTDVACFPSTSVATSNAGLCVPTCSSDVECPTGRSCAFNICFDSSVVTGPMGLTGDPLGSHCDPSLAGTANDTCKEQCVGAVGMPPAFCSTYCVVNSVTACNFVDKMTPLTGEHGICAPATTISGTGNGAIGDVGICVQQCDKNADCLDQTDTLVCNTTDTTEHGFCTTM